MLSGNRSLPGVVVHLESGFVPLHTPVTRASYFRRRCARRRVLLKTTRYLLALTPHHRTVARHCTATAAIVIGTATATAYRSRSRSRDCDRDRDGDCSTPTYHLKWGFPGECGGLSPRRSRRPPQTSTEARGFPCRPVRDARSAEWELMSPLSLARNVREHVFQMHHYPLQTTVPT